jgi:hypothetical protein
MNFGFPVLSDSTSVVRNRRLLPFKVLFIVLAILSIGYSISWITEPPAEFGWDARVVCSAWKAVLKGLNPYVRENLGDSPFSFVYLPHAALLSSPMCALPVETLLYAWLSLLTFMSSIIYLLRKFGCNWFDSVVLAAIAPSIFASFKWIVITGNPSVLNLPFLVGALISFLRRRYVMSGVMLGAMASIKLVPAIDLIAYFLVLPFPVALAASAAGVATFVAILMVNLIAMGSEARLALFELLMRTTPGSSVTGENTGKLSEGWADPNAIDLLINLLDKHGIHHRTLVVSAAAVAALLVATAIQRLRYAGFSRGNLFETQLFCFSLLAINLFLFRLKPYAFSDLTPLIAICCISLPLCVRWLPLLIGCILAFKNYPVDAADTSSIAVMYAQSLALITTSALLYLLFWFSPGRSSSSAVQSR